MSEGPGLIVDVGGARGRRVPGALVAGAGDDADVPFAPGEEFPFDDCAANVLAIGAFATRLSPAAALHLLLECRRVLRPGGVIHVATDDGATSDGAGHGDSSEATERLERLATMAGLERAQHIPQSGVPFDALFAGGIAMTKRERRVRGDPLVSIVIPAYNPRFFAECLDSALRQTYGNTDIVVTDDSAGPEIASIVASRGSQRPVRYQRNPTQLRPRGNFIRCFEEARGEFVKFLCDDDVLAPACVEQLVDAFRRAPDVTLATSRRARIGEAGVRLPDLPATFPIVAESSVIAGYTLANAMLMAGLNTVGEPSTVLFRKSDFTDAALGYFHFNGAPGRGVIDMVMWASLLLKGNAVYLHECLSSFRNHTGQRQSDPATRHLSIASIRELQAAWLALGLHERQAPDQILARRFPTGDDDWRAQRVRGFAARRVSG